MALLTLLALGVVATFAPGAPEATAVLYVEKLHWNQTVVAVGIAFGECISFSALYVFGRQLIARWKWLDVQVEQVREKYRFHLEQRFLVASGVAGVFGFPPAVALAILGPGFRVPYRHLLPVLFVCRVVRFMVIIYFGDRLIVFARGLW